MMRLRSLMNFGQSSGVSNAWPMSEKYLDQQSHPWYRTRVGRCRDILSKWGFTDASSNICESGAALLTMAYLSIYWHVIYARRAAHTANSCKALCTQRAEYWAGKKYYLSGIDRHEKKKTVAPKRISVQIDHLLLQLFVPILCLL